MKDEEVQLLFSLLTTHRKQKQVAAGGNVTSCLEGLGGGATMPPREAAELPGVDSTFEKHSLT